MTDKNATDKNGSNLGKVELEITPAMIAAGAIALASYEPMFESFEEAAARIFRAMSQPPK